MLSASAFSHSRRPKYDATSKKDSGVAFLLSSQDAIVILVQCLLLPVVVMLCSSTEKRV